jgi:thermitase
MRNLHIRYVLLALVLLVLISSGSAISQQAQVNVPESYLAQVAGNGIVFPSENLYASDEILVRFVPGANRAVAAGLHAQIGATVKKEFTPYGLEGLQVVNLPPGLTVSQAIEHYSRNPNVLYAEPNYVVQAAEIPDDYYFDDLWGLHNEGQTGGTDDSDIDAPEAWDLTTGSPNVIIAVVDSGVDYNHPDLAANIWSNTDEIAGNRLDDDGNGYVDDVRGWDFYNDDNNPMDDNGHGTHCAGTIGAVGDNGIGVAGVMWTAQIMPLKFLNRKGSGYTSDAVSAILYANSNGAHVISNSWGGGGFSISLKAAIDASDAVVACAAGNSGLDTDETPHYPSSYTSPQIIAVAATDDDDYLASFSNYGITSVDVAAPGVSILSTYKGGLYAWMSGTSMATPHVAGLAGALKARYPGMSNTEIKERIMETVDWDSALAGKIATGGRINAYQALLSSTPLVPPTAGFTAVPLSGEAPLTVQFTDQSTDAPTAWAWDFESDGEVDSTLQDPSHVYDTAGTYTVTLTATNAGGSDEVVMTDYITVTATPVPPVAAFTADVTSGTAPLTVQFTDQSTGFPTAWAWDFDNDGTVNSEQQNPSHVYDTAGTYTVTLAVTNAGGSDDVVMTDYIAVNEPVVPVPTITNLDPLSISPGSSKFKLTVTGENFVSGAKVLWDGGERKTVFLTSTQLRAWILASDVEEAGDYNVTVRNPDGTRSINSTFTVI